MYQMECSLFRYVQIKLWSPSRSCAISIGRGAVGSKGSVDHTLFYVGSAFDD